MGLKSVNAFRARCGLSLFFIAVFGFVTKFQQSKCGTQRNNDDCDIFTLANTAAIVPKSLIDSSVNGLQLVLTSELIEGADAELPDEGGEHQSRASGSSAAEALPVFYRNNRFHYTVFPADFSIHYDQNVDEITGLFTRHKDFMRHLSLDDCQAANYPVARADIKIPNWIHFLLQDCPDLRTFTVHIFTLGNQAAFESVLSAESNTAMKLAGLRARAQDSKSNFQWLAVIRHGGVGTLLHLRNGIARNGWVMRAYKEWPKISLDNPEERWVRYCSSNYLPISPTSYLDNMTKAASRLGYDVGLVRYQILAYADRNNFCHSG